MPPIEPRRCEAAKEGRDVARTTVKHASRYDVKIFGYGFKVYHFYPGRTNATKQNLRRRFRLCGNEQTLVLARRIDLPVHLCQRYRVRFNRAPLYTTVPELWEFKPRPAVEEASDFLRPEVGDVKAKVASEKTCTFRTVKAPRWNYWQDLREQMRGVHPELVSSAREKGDLSLKRSLSVRKVAPQERKSRPTPKKKESIVKRNDTQRNRPPPTARGRSTSQMGSLQCVEPQRESRPWDWMSRIGDDPYLYTILMLIIIAGAITTIDEDNILLALFIMLFGLIIGMYGMRKKVTGRAAHAKKAKQSRQALRIGYWATAIYALLVLSLYLLKLAGV